MEEGLQERMCRDKKIAATEDKDAGTEWGHSKSKCEMVSGK